MLKLVCSLLFLLMQTNPNFRISSAAFGENQPIPATFTCSGDNASPALRWQGAPAGTRSFALILHDPDAPAGDFTHWTVYDLPASLTELPSGKYQSAQFPLGGLEGRNSFGDLGYGGPCPPPGTPHHYIFELYALSQASLGLPAGASRDQIAAALKDKILARTTLTGLFSR